jgi:hypothetical protein
LLAYVIRLEYVLLPQREQLPILDA